MLKKEIKCPHIMWDIINATTEHKPPHVCLHTAHTLQLIVDRTAMRSTLSHTPSISDRAQAVYNNHKQGTVINRATHRGAAIKQASHPIIMCETAHPTDQIQCEC